MDILLSGFMGAGKSHFLAKMEKDSKMLDCFELIDLDQVLVSDYLKMPIVTYADKHSFVTFRKLESRALEDILIVKSKAHRVIALGGGAIYHIGSLAEKFDFKVFWFNTDFDTCYERVKDSDRPLVGGKEELRLLYQNRLDMYATCHACLSEKEQEEITSLDDFSKNYLAKLPEFSA